MYRKWIWAAFVALPFGISGLVYATSQSAADTKAGNTGGFICPITGEELPCEKCCPLNG